MHRNIPKIVITGGPCGGKTTALAKIVAWCLEHGFYPLLSPEAATLLMESGIERDHPRFQEFIWRETQHAMQLRLEAALLYKNPVLIFDRAFADSLAYMSTDGAKQLMDEFGFTIKDVRDQFSGVIFLRTAANGAAEHYTTENNAKRSESAEEACATDWRTEMAWTGTPHLHLIENVPGQTFDQKINRALQALARTLGVPEPLEIERKFLIHDPQSIILPESATPITIIQHYLVGNGSNERVRARGQDDNYLYFHTIKEEVAPGTFIETERHISRQEYDDLIVRRDYGRQPIIKTRNCFSYNGRYCELDVFHGRREGLVMLEIEVASMDETVSVPPYLGEYTEVTGKREYSNYELSLAA